jgi:hypothetical protein
MGELTNGVKSGGGIELKGVGKRGVSFSSAMATQSTMEK